MTLTKTIEGTFVSGATNKFLSLPYVPAKFQWWNKTKFASTSTSPHYMQQGIAFSEDSSATGYGLISGASPISGILDAGTGIQFVSAGSYQYGPVFTITGIVASTGVVTTSVANGYAVGDTVLLYATTGELQIAGTLTTITAINSATTFTIGNIPTSGFAADATAGFVKKLLYPDLYIPFNCPITGVTTGATTIVQLAVNHAFVVGQEVVFIIPQLSQATGVWGMQQLDSDYVLKTTGIPQQAYVTAVTASTITVNVNSTGFTAFAYPTSAQAAMGCTFPQVVAIGDGNTGYSLVNGQPPFLGVKNGVIGVPGAFVANTRQGVVVPTAATYATGTAVTLHTTSDVIHWTASYPDGILLNQ